MSPNAAAAGERHETPEQRQKRLLPLFATRQREREEWDAYWKIWDIESRGNFYRRCQYFFWRGVNKPVTFWRENVIEPIQDKYGHLPYYHRRLRRVPTIDECHVNDQVCYHEAQMQYRLDKLVDHKILDLLRSRRDECLTHHHNNVTKCIPQFDDFEEAELNWYIKFGELGLQGDVLSCYMKQKHRLIWERRNPHILAEREKAHEQHKRDSANGIYDHWFWKRGAAFMFKDEHVSEVRKSNIQMTTLGKLSEPEQVSMDPEYHRKRKEDGAKVASSFDVFP